MNALFDLPFRLIFLIQIAKSNRNCQLVRILGFDYEKESLGETSNEDYTSIIHGDINVNFNFKRKMGLIRKSISILFLLFGLYSQNSLANLNNHEIDSTIPLKFFNNEPMIDVKINSYSSALIVDLGTTMADAVLFKTVLKKSHAKYLGKIKGCYFNNYRGDKFPCKQYIIDEIIIGRISFKNLKVFEFPGIKYFNDGPIKVNDPLNNGTIGVSLLKRFNLILDYRNNKMIIKKGNILNIAPKNPSGLGSFKFYYGKSGNILINGKINNIPVIVMFDTGNTESTINPSTVLKINKLKNITNIKILSVTNFKLESHNYGKQDFLVKNSNSEANVSLGKSFFIHHVVYFDFKNNIISIE